MLSYRIEVNTTMIDEWMFLYARSPVFISRCFTDMDFMLTTGRTVHTDICEHICMRVTKDTAMPSYPFE